MNCSFWIYRPPPAKLIHIEIALSGGWTRERAAEEAGAGSHASKQQSGRGDQAQQTEPEAATGNEKTGATGGEQGSGGLARPLGRHPQDDPCT